MNKLIAACVCSWNRRLWTLQEAVSAQNLISQFEDGHRDIDDLHRSWKKIIQEAPDARFDLSGNASINPAYRSLRMQQGEQEPKFPAVIDALLFRPMSVVQDEPPRFLVPVHWGSGLGIMLDTPPEERINFFRRLFVSVDRRTLGPHSARLREFLWNLWKNCDGLRAA